MYIFSSALAKSRFIHDHFANESSDWLRAQGGLDFDKISTCHVAYGVRDVVFDIDFELHLMPPRFL